ncbi:MAG: gamma-glutamylcyclotransferase [Myxococcota bacterium]
MPHHEHIGNDPKTGDWIFFYGSLMRGLGALDEIPSKSALRYIGPGQVRGRLYDLGPYPGLLSGDRGDFVRGELHAILDCGVIEELDHFEGFVPEAPEDSLYLRRKVRLAPPIDNERIDVHPAPKVWVYFYNHTPEGAERVDSGDWRAHLSARAK